MKKKVTKAKVTKKSPAKSAAPETEMPDLIAVMTKLTERLESLEKKMEVVISQTAGRQQNHQQHQPRPQQQHAQPHHNAPRPQQHNFNQHPQHGNRQPQHNQNVPPQHHQNRPQNGGRPMFKATCGDCKQSCEIPFQPSAERPVYCKECFAKRKSGGNVHKPSAPAPHHSPMQLKQVKVIPNGVGKVTISDFVPPAAAKKKEVKPVKKAKR